MTIDFGTCGVSGAATRTWWVSGMRNSMLTRQRCRCLASYRRYAALMDEYGRLLLQELNRDGYFERSKLCESNNQPGAGLWHTSSTVRDALAAGYARHRATVMPVSVRRRGTSRCARMLELWLRAVVWCESGSSNSGASAMILSVTRLFGAG